MKRADTDVVGFFETIVEFYTGRDASQLSDDALALKVGHIVKIRNMEANSNKTN